jgi:hypothetical protein
LTHAKKNSNIIFNLIEFFVRYAILKNNIIVCPKLRLLMLFSRKISLPAVIAGLAAGAHSSIHAFWGATELDLKGIGVIKEAAEVLAAAAAQIPGRTTGIALLGFACATIGIFKLHKGFVDLLVPTNSPVNERVESRKRALVHTLISFYFLFFGCIIMIYATGISRWI